MVILLCCLHSWNWSVCCFRWFLLLRMEDCQWIKSTNANWFLGRSDCCSVHHLSIQLLLVRVKHVSLHSGTAILSENVIILTHSRLPKGDSWSVFLKRFVWYALFAPAIIIGKESYFLSVHIQTLESNLLCSWLGIFSGWSHLCENSKGPRILIRIHNSICQRRFHENVACSWIPCFWRQHKK